MLQIEEHEVLVALYRTVIEGKFADDPEDGLVARSPHAADACVRIRKALEDSERVRIEQLEGPRRQLAERNWEDRRGRFRLDARPRLLAVVRRRLRELEEWSTLEADSRGELITTLAAPFDLSRDLHAELLAYANEHHGVGPV